MKKIIIIFIAVLFCKTIYSQEKTSVFKKGEWLRFKMSYGGFLKAGNVILSVDKAVLNGKEVFHVTGKGWTTGLIGLFFEVNDNYQSYFDIKTGKPYLFKRDIDEGGYKIQRQINFDYNANKAIIQDFKHKTTNTVDIGDIQDIMSSFYFLRNYDATKLKIGDEIKLNIFIDAKIYPFKLRLLGTEILKTSFGKIKTLCFRPLVQSGRIFKENESVTIWITADNNKILVKMKASLIIGSLTAELDAYKGLSNSFEIIYD